MKSTKSILNERNSVLINHFEPPKKVNSIFIILYFVITRQHVITKYTELLQLNSIDTAFELQILVL